MIFIKYFETVQEKQSCIDTYKYMSYTDEDKVVNIHPYDYSKDYLTFIAKTSGMFKFNGTTANSIPNKIQYSIDNGETWSEQIQDVEINVNVGDKVLWKGEMTPNSSGIGTFKNGTADFDIYGNIMSLLYGDNFIGQTDLTGKSYAFAGLFITITKCIDASNLILPATTLSDYCYYNMFYNNHAIKVSPKILVATTTTKNCYQNMFSYCIELIKGPELPATTLAEYCYDNMFNGCTSLTKAPLLPATTVAQYCYNSMFNGCTSLTKAPSILPATTLAAYCYQDMFNGCTSLTKAPLLPATTLAEYCYQKMFKDCINLIKIPSVLPATTLILCCYNEMFSGCTSITKMPEIPVASYGNRCCVSMFSGCTSLKTTQSALQMTSMDEYCCYQMFDGCTSLVNAPELPETTLARNCYT